MQINSKKNKLNLQIRKLGQAPQPVVESDMASVGDTELASVTGGISVGGGDQMAFGRTRSCGEAVNV